MAKYQTALEVAVVLMFIVWFLMGIIVGLLLGLKALLIWILSLVTFILKSVKNDWKQIEAGRHRITPSPFALLQFAKNKGWLR